METTQRKYPKIIFAIMSVAFMYFMLMALKQTYYYSKIRYKTYALESIALVIVVYVVDAHLPSYWMFFWLQIGSIVTLAAYSIAVSFPLETSRIYIYLIHLLLYIIARPLDALCIPFMGSHFVMPDQVMEYQDTVSFYWWLTRAVGEPVGEMLGRSMDLHFYCHGETTCPESCIYLSALITIPAVIITISFKSKFSVKWPEEDPFKKIYMLIRHARRRKSKSTRRRKHWLDYARDKYDREFIDDVKKFRFLFVMFVPWFIVYYSDAAMQADVNTVTKKLNWGKFSAEYVYIFTDSLYMVSILLAAPLLEFVIFPWLTARNFLTTSMGRFNTGLVFLALSALCAGSLWTRIENEEKSFRMRNLRMFNPLGCNMEIRGLLENRIIFVSYLSVQYRMVPLKSNEEEEHIFRYTCGNYSGKGIVRLSGDYTMDIYITEHGHIVMFKDNSLDVFDGRPVIRFVDNLQKTVSYDVYNYHLDFKTISNKVLLLYHGIYNITADGIHIGSKTFELGGIYVVLINFEPDGKVYSAPINLKEPNRLYIFWILPQCIFCAIGTTMATVAVFSLSYIESPDCVKYTGCGLAYMAEIFSYPALTISQTLLGGQESTRSFVLCGILIITFIVCIVLTTKCRCLSYDPIVDTR